ncbi:MAG TPA: histidinol-phosphate transaminase [Zoogloea sp.]|uniref:histidinol-phosphate transaminase n=1 Tax=Zoogloea sp. TaxID=49181 RepID=UPI002CA02BC2|nr:histidinol-phosphate transaminase [Zoogloea sp.]HOB47273.1 histidinol-phosphate transaminase [Zoogloea sp.]HQA10123.1 histidinol-phosphate transaminase [Zoogloea sp.]HQE39563.1 histidinol-phosphate transaminase [Zoogloea sp.]
MSRFWSPIVHDLTPYVPGEQPKLANLVKLNTNENPYPPSPKVRDAILAELDKDADRLKLYPDPTGSQLKAAVARHFGVPAEWVFVGNSSDEVLAHTFQALLKHDKPLLFPDITYSFYPVYCGLYGIDFETVPLSDEFEIRIDDYLARGAANLGAAIFPNPNAPTGRLLPLAEIARLAAALPDAPIVIDEAYVDFGGLDAIPTAVELVKRHPNILVIQTLSKSRSLAGLRVGFAIGQPELIEALTRVKDSFNSYPLDRLALAGASAALDDEGWFEQTRRQVIASRESLAANLGALGFEVLPSAANFVFARHPQHDAATLAARLRERSIIVRHFKAARIDQFLRITVGTDAQCVLLIDALREIVG